MAKTPMRMMAEAIRSADSMEVKQVLRDHPEMLTLIMASDTWLHYAASESNVEIVALLVELGLDVNVKREGTLSGPLSNAACDGKFEIAQWLLDNGADINAGAGRHGTPLISAIQSKSLKMVKLMLERGADLNAQWDSPPMNPLKFAETYGHDEIAEYLRSQGALHPGMQTQVNIGTIDAHKEILEHVRRHIGEPNSLALNEIVPGLVSVAIHVIPQTYDGECMALVTSGMSDRPMTVPKGAEQFQYAELIILLPLDWPLDEQSLKDENYYWPVEWLRRIAHLPHENDTWVYDEHIVSNGDPPKPFASNTQQVAMLVLNQGSEQSELILSDGRPVNFYELYPLYKEERDLQQKKGTRHLVELFYKHGMSQIVDTKRLNVAKGGQKGL